jgi:hypothetical protein
LYITRVVAEVRRSSRDVELDSLVAVFEQRKGEMERRLGASYMHGDVSKGGKKSSTMKDIRN